MRQAIKIEEIVDGTAVDTAGQPDRSWQTRKGCTRLPAEVLRVAGGEVLRGRQVAATTTVVATIRWRSDLDPTMRVVYDGNTYGLVAVHDPYGDRRELRLEMKGAT